MTRRGFLGWLLGGVLAHHKPSHRGGPPASSTTILPPTGDGDRYHDAY